ncbi:hypothetical protein C0992_009578 [Termitomyces sp. T32_za158]|nr:hypothetical protein C0992_009578 [Termitomyces sp. T32_za158]
MASPSELSRRPALARMPSHPLPKPRLSQAPQHNPYDKFTQDEFDAWIGGITGALKRALGQEDQVVSPPVTSSPYSEQFSSSDEEEVERLIEFVGNSSDEETETSLSYSTARRVSKGKARDPRDGPGFGRGEQNEPIFIGSDSDEEEEESEDGEDEVIEEWDSQSEEDDNEPDIDWEEAESSVQARIREKQDVVEENEEEKEAEEEAEDDEDDEDAEDEGDEEEEEESGGDEQQGEDDEDSYDAPFHKQSSPPVLVDSDEEVGVHDLAYQRPALDGTEHILQRSDEDTTDSSLATSIRVGPPRYRAKQRHVSPAGVENYDDVQPLANDTSFPPHEIISPANEDTFVELPDRWVGPETYAEDYFSGGDVKESHNSAADVLGMEHDERQHSLERCDKVAQAQDVIQLGIDEVQPLSEDTSFPPKVTEGDHFSFTSHQPIEIPDPWVGPKTYAEDFYSGGDVRPLPNGSLNPHRLGLDEQSGIMTSVPRHEVEQGEAQPSANVGAGDLSNMDVYQSPQLDFTVELPEPWDGESDHLVQVEIKSSPHVVEDQSAVRDDSDTRKVVSFEDETALVKSQDTTAGSSHHAVKLVQEHVDGRVERVLDRIESLATSLHDDPLGQIALAQANASNVLYDGIIVPREPEYSVHDHNKDDAPVLDWINDTAFIHDIPSNFVADVERPSLNASTNEPIEVIDSNEKAAGEILARDTNVPALEAQLATAKVSVEKLVDAGEFPNEAQPEVGLENIPDDLNVLSSTSFGRTGVIEDASMSQHDKEHEVKNLLTMACNETETGDKTDVDADLVPREDLVIPGIREVEETDVTLDVCAGKMSPHPDTVSEVQREAFTQSTVENRIEVLNEEDPMIFADVASQELNFESSEPVAAALENSTLTLPEPELIVSRSATPTLIEGLQSLNGAVNTSVSVGTGEFGFQIAPAFQDNLTSADLMAHACLMSTPHSQSPDPRVVAQRSITDPPEAVSRRSLDLATTPSASETSESIPKEQNRLNSSIGQVESGVDPALSDQQPSPSVASTLFPDPALPWIGPYSMNVVMRKASEPFLFADPYPASLSTPDDRDYAVSFEHLLPRKFSPLSRGVPEGSTAVRNVVNGRNENQISVPAQITYVQPSDEVPPVQQDSSIVAPVQLGHDAHSTVAAALSSLPTFQESVVINTTKDTDPNGEVPLFRHNDLTAGELAHDVDSTLAKPVARGVSSSPTSKDFDQSLGLTGSMEPAKDNCDENTAQQSSPLSSPGVERADGPSTTRVRSPPLEDDLPSILIVKKVHTDDWTPVKAKSGRSRKRKRSSSVATSSHLPGLPGTGSLKQPDKNKAAPRLPVKPRVPNLKASRTEHGKGKEAGVSPISQGSCDRQSVSSRSSSDASAARRMLESSSRGTSRASSIASTAPSDNLIMQLSPTLGKSNSFRHQPLQPPPPPLPVPLLHRHHHNRPQQSRPAQNQRTSSSVRQHDPTESSTSKQSTSSLHRHPTYSSSPVTRSNCRYHKISIPLDDESDEEGSGDEDVKLVYFLVPGCSLGNKELNRDEKIIDHGDAQPSDGLLMTSDLDAYAFNAPLLSVLRLLVGVDMLREGEIYYLPLPDSDWVPRKVRETSAKMHQGSADYGPSYVTPRRNSNMSASSVSIAPVASHGPASTTLGPSRSLKPSSTISQTSSELTDVEDSPRLKRFRFSPAGEEDDISESKPEFGSRSRKPKVLSENRSNSHDESNHLDEYAAGRVSSNKGNKHGVKRTRTSDVIRGNDDGQKLKKQKIGGNLPTASSS